MLLQLHQVGPDDLHGVVAADAGERFVDVVADVLREVPVHGHQRFGDLAIQGVDQLVLGAGAGLAGGNRPLVVRLQRHVAFRAVEARRIGAVVGTADLADHLFALRVALDDAAHDLHPLAHLLQRRFQREGARDPDVALLEFGQELAAQHGDHRGGGRHDQGEHPQRQPAMPQAAVQLPQVGSLQRAHQPVVGPGLDF